MMNRNERIRILAPYPLVVKDQSAIEEAVIGAVDDMKKLEKIEQIFKDIEECELVEDYALDEIREIVEDGNVD